MIKNKERSLFICGTPYQLFNAINLIENGNGSEEIDLLVFDRFGNAASCCDNIEKIGIVDKVCLLRDYQLGESLPDKCPSILKKAVNAFSYLTPQTSAKRYFVDGEEAQLFLERDRYSRLYAPTPSFLLLCLEKLNIDAALFYYEDGLGSYYGNFNKESACPERKLFSKIFKVGYNVIDVSALYVYSPEMCGSSVAKEIRSMPRIDKSTEDLLNAVFNMRENSVHYDNKIVWMSQPMMDKCSENVLDILKGCDSVVVRMHPKSKDMGLFKNKGFTVDESKSMWELSIADDNLENTVIIGSFSTALATPKILYDKEPTVIFTYKTQNITNAEILNKIEHFVAGLKSIYRDSGKILVPENDEQLKSMVSNVWNSMK